MVGIYESITIFFEVFFLKILLNMHIYMQKKNKKETS